MNTTTKGAPPSYVASLQNLQEMLQKLDIEGAQAYIKRVLGEEQALNDKADDIEASLVETRKWILIGGFLLILAVTGVMAYIIRKNPNKKKFCAVVFMQMSAAVLYAGAIVPQILLFEKVKSRATDGVMTSFLALAMLAVCIGLIGRGFGLKSAYNEYFKDNESLTYITQWVGMGVVIVPFGLHVYMIYQISKYNDDMTPTTLSSKKLAHWAWLALALLYIVLWGAMATFGSKKPKYILENSKNTSIKSNVV